MIKIAAKPGALLGWMESLADETRLRLLHLLERHELGVAELCDILQLPQSTTSRHLKLLSDAINCSHESKHPYKVLMCNGVRVWAW